MTRWRLYWRSLIGCIWLIVAVIAVVTAARAQDELRRLSRQAAEERLRRLLTAQRAVLDAVLEHASGVPDDLQFRWTLYIHDGSGILFPSWPETVDDPHDPRVFRVGSGATGLAFAERNKVVVIGDRVSDGSYGLTAAQQARYARDRTVVAIPLRNARTVIGVLSGISPVETTFFTEEGGTYVADSLASVVGTVVAELGGDR